LPTPGYDTSDQALRYAKRKGKREASFCHRPLTKLTKLPYHGKAGVYFKTIGGETPTTKGNPVVMILTREVFILDVYDDRSLGINSRYNVLHQAT